MSESTITVSNGEDFFRIPLSDLAEATEDGFYVPALNGSTIVSNGDELFEIPLEDLPEAQADGFFDLMVAEQGVVEQARILLDESGNVFDVDDADKEPSTSNDQDTVAASETLVAPAISTTAADPAAPSNSVTDVDAADLPEAPEPEDDGSAVSKFLLPGGTIGGKSTWQVMAINIGLHALILLLLAMIILPTPEFDVFMEITSAIEPNDPTEMDFESVELAQPMELTSDNSEAEVPNEFEIESPDMVEMDVSDVEVSIPDQPTLSDSATGPPSNNASELGGRSKAGRAAAVAKRGGSAASEAAVMKGLVWMAHHQYPDGGWSYDHAKGECAGKCSQAGSLSADCRTAATGMALLAMLGAGNTPYSGEFQKEVRAGVAFLLKNARMVGAGLDLRSQHAGNTGMYTQAIATTALCEILAMTKHEYDMAKSSRDDDEKRLNPERFKLMKQLRLAAQGGINFIIAAQHGPSGGWGYDPGKPGDTSILGWQVMALKSGAHAKLRFSGDTIVKANRFLTSVQTPDGWFGYRGPDKKLSTTAIGIIARMLSGMPREHAQLKMGVAHISAAGPQQKNMYHNYYATQVMMHYGGEPWQKWNAVMRDRLVNSQVKEGHAAGSWNLADSHGAKGGRLYMTALCTMTLEVYYRHMPLYGEPDETEMEGETDQKSIDLTGKDVVSD